VCCYIKSLVDASFATNIYLISLMILIEDVGAFTKLPALITVSLLTVIGLKVSNISLLSNTST